MASAKEPYFASSPCALGSLRAAAGISLGEALCPPIPTTRLRDPSPREGWRSASSRQSPRPHCGRQYLSPAAAAGHLALPSARPKMLQETGWPADLVARAGMGVRGLVPRGTLFERYMTCPVEPTRNGLYQFCIVGLDATPGSPRYLGWEPTGYFDRWFHCDEVDLRLALQRAHQVYKEGEREAVRWPDAANAHESLVYAGRLPKLTSRGLPTITADCKHHPRNTIDLMGPLLYEWQKRFLSLLRLDRCRTLQLLVLDGSARLARHLQDSLEDVEVFATDAKKLPKPKPLGSLRDKARTSVDYDRLQTAPPALKLTENEFDVVVIPFVSQRLCKGDLKALLTMMREALRCCSGHVLIAEDLAEEQLVEWKQVIQGDWSATILMDGTLPSGEVKDHFLSPICDSRERRYLVIDAASFQDRKEARAVPGFKRSFTTPV